MDGLGPLSAAGHDLMDSLEGEKSVLAGCRSIPDPPSTEAPANTGQEEGIECERAVMDGQRLAKDP